MKSVCVITPTVGSEHLSQCVESVINQTYNNVRHQIVIDGHEYCNKVFDQIDISNNTLVLSQNVGADGWYGHRIYTAFSYLVNEDYIIYLDEDNWLEPNHVEDLITVIEKNNLHWAHSLRNIYSKEGEFICQDNCENLGRWPSIAGYTHIDTSCFCVMKDAAISCASHWFDKWGADRRFQGALRTYSNSWMTSGKYSLNYRLGGNPGSPKQEFFINGNIAMEQRYAKSGLDKFPWSKEGNG